MSDSLTDEEIPAWLERRLQLGLPAHLGIRVEAIGSRRLTLAMTVAHYHIAANGFLHAGAIVTLADTACGFGCLVHLPAGATSFTTIELKSNFLRTATEGTIRAKAQLQHGGRRTQVWDAAVVDEQERTLALFRCSQMILYR